MNAVQEILVGDSDVVLTGGSDNMSACPYAVRDIRSDRAEAWRKIGTTLEGHKL